MLGALDWVDIKGFQMRVASIVLKGRGSPIMLQRIDATAAQAFAAVLKQSEAVSPNWG
jgi:hypothetical protein